MENQNQIIGSIQKRRADGLTDEQITATLVNQGLSDEEIKNLLDASYKSPVEYTAPAETAEKPKKKGWWPFRK